MKLAIVLMIATAAGAQTITTSGPAIAHGLIVGEAPKPLTCPKYQHFEEAHLADCALNSDHIMECDTEVPDRCVDDLHTVTEREWQEILKRLKKLEAK